MNLERTFATISERLSHKEFLIPVVAEALHETWRQRYKNDPTHQLEGGVIKPRLKITTDTAWIEEHGTNEVDIYHEPFSNLPEDWKYENQASAEVALDLIAEALSNHEPIDASFIEKASAIIHEKWLERNGTYAPPGQNMPYTELEDTEKEADRLVIRETIRVFLNQ